MPVAATRCSPPDHEVVAVADPPGRAGRARPDAAPVAVAGATRAPRPGIEVLTPADARATRSSSSALRELAPDCCPVVAYGGLRPAAPRSASPARLGQPALLAAARLARRAPRCSTRSGRRRRHRRHARSSLEEGLDTGPVSARSPRRSADRHRRRPARRAWPSPAPGCWSRPRRARGRRCRPPVPQPADGVSLRPQAHRRRRPGRLGASRPCASTGRSAPAPRRPVRGRSSAASGSRSGRSRAGPGGGDDTDDTARPPWRAGRHRRRAGGPRRAPATGPVRLGEVQAPGKRPMPAADWARGARLAAGERSAGFDELTDAVRRRRGRAGAVRPARDRRRTDPARLAAYDVLRRSTTTTPTPTSSCRGCSATRD